MIEKRPFFYFIYLFIYLFVQGFYRNAFRRLRNVVKTHRIYIKEYFKIFKNNIDNNNYKKILRMRAITKFAVTLLLQEITATSK